MKIGRVISVEAFDPPIFASLCSPNLNTALQRLAAFKRLIGPMHMAVTIGPQHTAVTLTCYGHDEPIPISLSATELVFFTQLARLATRRRIEPLQLALPRLPEQMAPYEAFFGKAICPGKAIRIVFSAEDAVYPFLTEDAAMWDFFEPELRRRLSEIESGASTTERVRGALLELLPAGNGSMEDVSRELAVSSRTLQRKLQSEGTTFQAVLNETREALARHYLSHATIPTAEISFLLGYEDPNSFYRAFRAWTGQTPEQVRLAAA